MNIQTLINDRVTQALRTVGAPEDSPALVRQSAKPQFGHYQANGVMAAAKKMGENPRALAQKVVDALDISDLTSKVEIAGPGFINLSLSDDFLTQQASQALKDDRLNIALASPQTVVADYSGPNIAKEMHVGHLRSTIIGDAVVRTLEFLGHNVIRANHIGDWGTQFGMLLANLERIEQSNEPISMELADLEAFYRESKKRYDDDDDFAVKARQFVVKLQSGDEYCLSLWQKLVDITMTQNQICYDRLNVSLSNKDLMGESMYNEMLPAIVADLKAKGLATESEGATVVYLEAYKNKEGNPMGVIIQKQDGGYLYSTTDIACAKYRYEQLNADRILYFIDSRQHQHLMQAWTIARQAGYIPESLSLEHHAFGMMLGKDGRPFKTREGGTVRLKDLLNEAEARAATLIESKTPDLEPDTKAHIANTVAMAAVKYSDLSKNRTTDYVFDWDLMLSFEGNTAPYLLYAYTRIASIFTQVATAINDHQGEITFHNDKERVLAVKLIQFSEAVEATAREGQPHIICSYLYELAGHFSSFYEACPILSAEQQQVRDSRLNLCALTARTIKQGLDLLGINTLDKM